MIGIMYIIMLMVSIMMMETNYKRRMVTANVTSYLPMANFIASMGKQHDTILSVQEHHVEVGKLGEFQDKIGDLGWRGLWTPAATTTRGGTTGGVAIVAPTTIMLTRPPGLESHVLWGARAIAAHAQWGVRGGIIIINAYLNTELQFEGENMAIV